MVRLKWAPTSVALGVAGLFLAGCESAVPPLAPIKDDDWVGSLQAKVKREKARGVTHLLFVQRDDKDIKYAALVPLPELVQIWTDQRDISKRLIG